MKHEESDHQKAVIQWANLSLKKYPCLKYLYACPNEGKHKPQYRKHQKAMGVKSGVPDLFLPFPMLIYNEWRTGSDQFHGLYIEMKAGKNKPTENQILWIDYLRSVGYRVAICWNCDDAINVIKEYLKGN